MSLLRICDLLYMVQAMNFRCVRVVLESCIVAVQSDSMFATIFVVAAIVHHLHHTHHLHHAPAFEPTLSQSWRNNGFPLQNIDLGLDM